MKLAIQNTELRENLRLTLRERRYKDWLVMPAIMKATEMEVELFYITGNQFLL